MGALDDFLDFFKGTPKQGKQLVKPEAQNWARAQLSEANRSEILNRVDRVVEMDSWLFHDEEETDFYHNESLEKAMEIGREVREMRSYLSREQVYEGVDLNEDVLSTVLEHFLATVDVYEYVACQFDLQEIYRKAMRTPRELLKYIIEERQKKLYQALEQEKERGNSGDLGADFARRLFEFDLLIQLEHREDPADQNFVRDCGQTFAKGVYERYNTQKEANFSEESGDFSAQPRTADVIGAEPGEEIPPEETAVEKEEEEHFGGEGPFTPGEE